MNISINFALPDDNIDYYHIIPMSLPHRFLLDAIHRSFLRLHRMDYWHRSGVEGVEFLEEWRC